MKDIKLGKYQHFKGGVYEVVAVAKHSETLKEMVVYKSEEGEFRVRQKNMFMENVFVDDKETPRFKYIGK